MTNEGRAPSQLAQVMAMDVLTIGHVSRHFGGIHVLDDLSLAAQSGKILAILGPNGAGKTALIHGISARYHPHCGRIPAKNQDFTHLPPHKSVRLRSARPFQNVAPFQGMTVLDNLMLSRHVHMTLTVAIIRANGAVPTLVPA